MNKELEMKVFECFSKNWALVTAGDEKAYNTMTIGWGALGTLWSKPMATVYIRKNRYTHEFMDRDDYFTVSFYPESCRKALGVLGSKSGKDGDKVAEVGFTPEFLEHGVTFKEATLTLVCRKLMVKDIEEKDLPEEINESMYPDRIYHTMYFGEVIDVIER